MTTLLKVNTVQYVWDNEKNKMSPLCRLYFCKHCIDLRSLHNVMHEVDSHFCPQSQEGLPSAEAMLKKNKSGNCSQCPSCFHVLSTRATSKQVKSKDDPVNDTMKKFYYLSCTFCRWTSREVGIEDRTKVSGEWTTNKLESQDRIMDIMKYYKYKDAKENQELEQKKLEKRRGYTSQIKLKYSKLSKNIKPHPASPYAGSLSAFNMPFKDLTKEVIIEPSKTYSIEDESEITQEFYGKLDLINVSNIRQRLDQPAHQHEKLEDFQPRQTTMLIKKSLRCKKCEHNLIKPEYNPASIKFKIALCAIYLVPEIRISKTEDLHADSKSRFIFVVTNPTDNIKQITFMPKSVQGKTNGAAEMPPSVVKVYNYDEASELRATVEGKTEDSFDNEHIHEVKENKVYFYVHCTPDKNVEVGEDVWIAFEMKYDYYSSISVILPTTEITEQKPTWLTHTVFVNMGKLSA